MALTEKHCVPCEGGVPPLSAEAADALLTEVPMWTRDGDWIERHIQLPDFMACVDVVRDIADLAEDEGHHPDLHIESYRNLAIRLQTHAIGGLSENDFILAAKIERLLTRS